jgi:hypothetical protein
MTRTEEIVLQALPVVGMVVGLLILVNQCSAPSSQTRSPEGARELVQSGYQKHRITDCVYVRGLQHDENE